MLELEAQLADRDVTFDLTPEATRWLGEKGYDDAFGARPLARVIQENIKKPLADEILFGKLKDGGTVRVLLDREKDKLAFEFIPAAEAKPRAPRSAKARSRRPRKTSNADPVADRWRHGICTFAIAIDCRRQL